MIKYDPLKLLKKVAPKAKIKRMLKKDLTLKKAALTFVNEIDFLSKRDIAKVANKVSKNYRSRVKAEGGDKEMKDGFHKDPSLLINRVQNEVIFQVAKEIAGTYKGETYTWLPSSAEEADPEHQLNYGKTFVIGEGEMPGDRYGCKCGMLIHVKEKQLKL